MIRSRLALAALVACLDPTEVTVTITTDAPCPTTTNIVVTRPGDTTTTTASAVADTCDNGQVGTIVLVPSDSSQNDAVVRVVEGVGKSPDACEQDGYEGGCIVARRRVSYVSHASLPLPIDLHVDCLDVPCDEKTTCVHGSCVPIDHFDPDAGSRPPDSGVDAGSPAVTYVGSSFGSTTAGLLVISNIGTGQAGDLVLLMVQANSVACNLGVDSSWTLLKRDTDTNNSFQVQWSYRIAQVAEPTTYMLMGTCSAAKGIIAVYRNVSQSKPIVSFADEIATSPSTSPQLAGVAGTTLVLLNVEKGQTATWTDPPGTTKRLDVTFLIADAPITTSGQTPAYPAVYAGGGPFGALVADVSPP